MFGYDTYQTAKTLSDPKPSAADKAATLGLYGLNFVNPLRPFTATKTLGATSGTVSSAARTTQMEFAFARGASVQTPGVTTAGETFVRVGAAPQNLKFGSTSLSGAQPGTYAFPQATFDAIGPNPSALKNLGDLPGSAPQYFRTLSPPPGTPIQRGVVPGGQYGGVGGVQEVIFPSGF